MKPFPSIFILLLSLSLTVACNDDDDGGTPDDPTSQLPPATQTGAQTFGCLIDGQPFVPDRFGSGRPSAFYQFVDGAFTLGISGSSGGGSSMQGMSLGGFDIDALQEITYVLESENSGDLSGIYRIGGGIELRSPTSNNLPGNMIITNFDEDNFIISGTFDFTVKDNNGNDINITEGRFDLNYTN